VEEVALTQLLQRLPVSTGHLYHVTRSRAVMWSTDRKMDVLDKRTTNWRQL